MTDEALLNLLIQCQKIKDHRPLPSSQAWMSCVCCSTFSRTHARAFSERSLSFVIWTWYIEAKK